MVVSQIAVVAKRGQEVAPAKTAVLKPAEAVAALLAGVILGWSAPGMDYSLLAWIGLAPLFWTCLSCRRGNGLRQALLGTIVGMGYNLVYMHWYLQVRDSAWQSIFSINPAASCAVVWLLLSLWQALFIGAFCYVLHRLPLCAGFVPSMESKRVRLPLLTVAPILWVVLIEKIGNYPGLLGVPWSMLQYSQYQNPVVLQIASVIGGSGIAAAIVLCNLLLATFVELLWRDKNYSSDSPLAFADNRTAIVNLSFGALLLVGILVYGDATLTESSDSKAPLISVAALQSNLSPDVHKVSNIAAIGQFLKLSQETKADLCVWPEWSIPIDWTAQADLVNSFAGQARFNKQAWLLGVYDTAPGGGRYNAMGAIDADGRVVKSAYHKQYLVPFGEYVPQWIYQSPLMILVDPQHRVPMGVVAGDRTVNLNTAKANVGTMICFENCLPTLSASSVRNGAQLLVDSSNTTWFNYSNQLGKQLIAFSVLRAVENHRSFVFCTVLGPSAIIDPQGRILKKASIDRAVALESKVPLESDTTLFTRYCWF